MKRIYCRRRAISFFFRFSLFIFFCCRAFFSLMMRGIPRTCVCIENWSNFTVENERMHFINGIFHCDSSIVTASIDFVCTASKMRLKITKYHVVLFSINSPDEIPNSFRCYALRKIPRLHTSKSWGIHSKPERWTNQLVILLLFFAFGWFSPVQLQSMTFKLTAIMAWK